MNDEHTNILLLDEEYAPILMEEECKELKPILTDFVQYYIQHKDRPVKEWLSEKMQAELPDRTPEEIQQMVQEVITTLETNEKNKASLSEAISNGRSKERWFASTVQKAASAMSVQETVTYLNGLDEAIQTANEALYRTITTKSGAINQNPRLDGFIAEQYHAQTFNLNAEATGSPYHARVLEPDGKAYGKNSVDVVIDDAQGNIVRKYQVKYCKDAKATKQSFQEGNYRGQQSLVPKGQESEISRKVTTQLEAPDGTTSNPLTKSKAEQMREEAQNGNWHELDWNEYQTKDIAIGIGKQAGYAALQGAAIGIGFDVAQRLWNGEEIEAEEVVETALVSSADFGIKAAATGAVKVGVEKGILTGIPKGTPAGTIANIVHVAIENVKIAGKVMVGKLSLKDGMDKMEQTTVSTLAGLAAMGKGAATGAAIGTIFGPVGTAVGGFVGGTVGYLGGSKVAETIVKGAQKIRDGASKVVKKVSEGIKRAGNFVKRGIARLFSW